MPKTQPVIWLLGLQKTKPANQTAKLGQRLKTFLKKFFSRFWPQLLAQNIGATPADVPVRLLELPFDQTAFRALPPAKRRQQLERALSWLNQPARQALKIGMPLGLQMLLPPDRRPANLADGWHLAAQEFVRQLLAQTGAPNLKNTPLALLGVEDACPAERYICDALLAAGGQPVLYGARALSLAEYYYQKAGVALPVFGARKAIRSSRIIILLNSRRPRRQPVLRPQKSVFYFCEPQVSVPGSYKGAFSFGAFPAGQAAALLD